MKKKIGYRLFKIEEINFVLSNKLEELIKQLKEIYSTLNNNISSKK